MAAPEPFRRVLSGQTVINKWTILKHIGHGGYGEIYKVQSGDSKPCAMKVELKSANRRGLAAEIQILQNIQGSPYFPRLLDVGETEELRYLVIELLGPSVSYIRGDLPDQRFTMLTATLLAREMLKCLEELHSRGFVHRDVKPGNFLFRNDANHMLCLIDFGLARQYINRDTGAPLPPRASPGFVGTCSFASVYAHDGMDLSRRDDIISWLYTIVECVDRKLPWPGSRNKDQTYQMKKEITVSQLCRGLPRQFIPIFQRSMKISYYDKPDYDAYYVWLDEAIEELGGRGLPFDWELVPVRRSSFISLPHNTDNGPSVEDCSSDTSSMLRRGEMESQAVALSEHIPSEQPRLSPRTHSPCRSPRRRQTDPSCCMVA